MTTLTVRSFTPMIMMGLLIWALLHTPSSTVGQEMQYEPLILTGPDEISIGHSFLINVSSNGIMTAIEASYPGPERSWIFEKEVTKDGVTSFELPAAYCGTNISYRSLVKDEGKEGGYWSPSSDWFLITLVGWVDLDTDGLSDQWEELYDLDTDDPNEDADGDSLILLQEMYHLTDPSNANTDGDPMDDGWEAAQGTLPFQDDPNNDPDGDGWSNIREKTRGTAPRDPDDHPKDLEPTPWYWMVIITGVLLLILGYFVKQLFNKKKLENDMDDFDRRNACKK
ncbi:MAG: hypothetical protein JXA22_05205 [Candidatus Thermoplasmatota archaeon]|nr:hypothetical protein [Candidatus Thermoplasmatota archaeon]